MNLSAKSLRVSNVLESGFDRFWQSKIASSESVVYSKYKDDEVLGSILHVFVENLATQVKNLFIDFANYDWSALESHAHQLKGSSGLYGYMELSQLAGELESIFKLNQTERRVQVEPLLFAISSESSKIVAAYQDPA